MCKRERQGAKEREGKTTRIDRGEIKRDGAIERSLNSTSERRQSVLNARLRECARTCYVRVRVHIGASMYARCGIATEKVHVEGKGGIRGGGGDAIAGRRGRASREGELKRWRGKHKARPVSNDVISLVSQRVNNYGPSQAFQVGPAGLSRSLFLSFLRLSSLLPFLLLFTGPSRGLRRWSAGPSGVAVG